MKALGRVGGLAKPRTKLRERADDDLREQARQTLSAALAGKDVPKSALDAARSLFAYSPAKAPSEAPAEHPDYPKTANGRRVIGLADVLELALEHEGTKGIFANARMADVVKRCAAQVEEFEREGRIYGASDGNEAA